MDAFNKSGLCQGCHRTTRAILHRHFRENGAEGFMWVCSVCNRRNPFKGDALFIEKAIVQKHLTTEQIDALPVIMPAFVGRCAVCGARAVEVHHWAPRAIFGDDECEQWPKDFLCKEHHDKWHIAVTPQLVK